FCACVSSKLPGTPDPALPRDDPDRLSGGGAISAGHQSLTTTRTPIAGSLPAGGGFPAWLGSGHRALGGPTGLLAGSPLSLSAESTLGQTPAPRATSSVHVSTLSWLAGHQQLRRAGHSAHGHDAQNLGRQSHRQRCPYPTGLGQCFANLLAARQKRIRTVSK